MAEVRFVHAGDLSTADAHKLTWNQGDIGSRYQELAIVGDRVIGAWQYSLEWHRNRARIESCRTDVSTRYQRRGVARMLWMRAVVRWNPSRIEAVISTDQGRDFLARMRAYLALCAPETLLWVKTRSEDAESWDSHCEFWARELLIKVGEERRTAEAKQLATKKPAQLKAVT